MMSALRAFLVVSRYEFMFGGVFFLMIVSILATGSWQRMADSGLLIGLGIALWYLSHMLASQVNCIADHSLDRVYKRHLAAAVDRLGIRRIWLFVWGESLLALACAAYMFALTGKPLLPTLWIFGWLVSMGYSVEPFRFKRRGILNPLSLILVLYALPMLYGYHALSDRINANILLLLAATGLQMLSLIVLNELEDIPEDSIHGIRTPLVCYGLWPALPVVLVLFIVGAGMSLYLFSGLIESSWPKVSFLVLGSAGMAFIAKDIVALTVTAWQGRAAAIEDLRLIRLLGRRNSMHFAALGLVMCMGSIFSLY